MNEAVLESSALEVDWCWRYEQRHLTTSRRWPYENGKLLLDVAMKLKVRSSIKETSVDRISRDRSRGKRTQQIIAAAKDPAAKSADVAHREASLDRERTRVETLCHRELYQKSEATAQVPVAEVQRFSTIEINTRKQWLPADAADVLLKITAYLPNEIAHHRRSRCVRTISDATGTQNILKEYMAGEDTRRSQPLRTKLFLFKVHGITKQMDLSVFKLEGSPVHKRNPLARRPVRRTFFSPRRPLHGGLSDTRCKMESQHCKIGKNRM